MGRFDVQRYLRLRAYEHKGYWQIAITVDSGKEKTDDEQAWEYRFNENIPHATDERDQAWIVLVYALKQLEFEGAGGRSGGMDFPPLF